MSGCAHAQPIPYCTTAPKPKRYSCVGTDLAALSAEEELPPLELEPRRAAAVGLELPLELLLWYLILIWMISFWKLLSICRIPQVWLSHDENIPT